MASDSSSSPKASRGRKSMAQEVKRRSREPEPTKLQASIEELTASGHVFLQSAHWEEAIICLKKAYRAAAELQDSRVQRACSFNLGAAYIEMGRPEKGLDFLKRAQPRERGERVADLQFNLAVAHQTLGQNAAAAGYFLQAAQLYRSQGDGDSEGDTCMKLARCYIQLQDWGQAVRSFLRGGESYGVAGRSDLAAIALKEAGSYMIQSDQFTVDDIISVLTECQALSDSITDKHTLGELYLSLGLCYSQLRYFQEAVGCYQLGLSQKDSPPPHRAALLQNLGAALNSLGQYQQALDYHRQAAALHGSLGNRGSQARCFSNLALACRELKNNQEAAENFLHALQAFRDTGDHAGQCQMCEALGETYFKGRELQKSIQYYKQALAALPHCQDWCVSVQERLINKLTAALQRQLYLSLTRGLQRGKGPHVPPPRMNDRLTDVSVSRTGPQLLGQASSFSLQSYSQNSPKVTGQSHVDMKEEANDCGKVPDGLSQHLEADRQNQTVWIHPTNINDSQHPSEPPHPDSESSLARDPEDQPTGWADDSRTMRHFREWTSRFCSIM